MVDRDPVFSVIFDYQNSELINHNAFYTVVSNAS